MNTTTTLILTVDNKANSGNISNHFEISLDPNTNSISIQSNSNSSDNRIYSAVNDSNADSNIVIL